jgi:hypothetical protein
VSHCSMLGVKQVPLPHDQLHSVYAAAQWSWCCRAVYVLLMGGRRSVYMVYSTVLVVYKV